MPMPSNLVIIRLGTARIRLAVRGSPVRFSNEMTATECSTLGTAAGDFGEVHGCQRKTTAKRRAASAAAGMTSFFGVNSTVIFFEVAGLRGGAARSVVGRAWSIAG